MSYDSRQSLKFLFVSASGVTSGAGRHTALNANISHLQFVLQHVKYSILAQGKRDTLKALLAMFNVQKYNSYYLSKYIKFHCFCFAPDLLIN